MKFEPACVIGLRWIFRKRATAHIFLTNNSCPLHTHITNKFFKKRNLLRLKQCDHSYTTTCWQRFEKKFYTLIFTELKNPKNRKHMKSFQPYTVFSSKSEASFLQYALKFFGNWNLKFFGVYPRLHFGFCFK